VAIVGGAGSPCVGQACARDRAVLPKTAMAERLPRAAVLSRFVASVAKRCGPALARQARACDGFVCVDASVASACTDASFVRKPVRLVLDRFFLVQPQIVAYYRMNHSQGLVSCHI